MDTSTNGTFVNGIRVGKGKEVPLRVNDVLRLSQATGERNKLIECVLQIAADKFPAATLRRLKLCTCCSRCKASP